VGGLLAVKESSTNRNWNLNEMELEINSIQWLRLVSVRGQAGLAGASRIHLLRKTACFRPFCPVRLEPVLRRVVLEFSVRPASSSSSNVSLLF
jgi:hypothetical protein